MSIVGISLNMLTRDVPNIRRIVYSYSDE